METMMNPEKIRLRLQEIGKSQSDLARHMGIHKSQITRMIQNSRSLKASEVQMMARFLDVPTDDLIKDTIDEIMMQRTPTAAPRRKQDGVAEIDAIAGLGIGGEAGTDVIDGGHQDAVLAHWVLPQGYLAQELRVQESNARIIEVRGDSMEPTLRSGDRVMVNTVDRTPSPPGLFCLWDGWGVAVKRLEPVHQTTRIRVISDNDRHSPFEADISEINVIGRVIWLARRI